MFLHINEDKTKNNKCRQLILCNISPYVKEKFVGPVRILQDQKFLGVPGPMGPVTF